MSIALIKKVFLFNNKPICSRLKRQTKFHSLEFRFKPFKINKPYTPIVTLIIEFFVIAWNADMQAQTTYSTHG